MNIFKSIGAFFMSIVQCVAWFIPSVWDTKPEPAPYSIPDIGIAAATKEAAQTAGGGWYVVLEDNFDGNTLNEDVWMKSPHGLRNTEYWCDNMVRVENGECVVTAAVLDDNVCDVCPASGDFTSGIETRGKLEQAFGYFEARVKYPKAPGMWTAMWLQSNTMSRLGNGGRDGSEIDIYESIFYANPTKTGMCVHWDSYNNPWYRSVGTVVDTGKDLYDDYHVWGLLWTPESYTFFLDGEPIWRTGAGGVAQVEEFLRLTVEIRRGEWGPYGEPLGVFTATKDNPYEYFIDYVRIYQHTDFLDSIKSADDMKQPWLARQQWFLNWFE
ncbi:MAG: glycoside hydrolase family 16 protein [Oscillospiraceae bacterium]|nr:glycoside hydrolase family 16 protein [Oscillospiraceae bacterium]